VLIAIVIIIIIVMPGKRNMESAQIASVMMMDIVSGGKMNGIVQTASAISMKLVIHGSWN